MIVSEIKDIEKEDTHIYYRQKYTATAVYAILGTEKTGKIEFFVEYKPEGDCDIHVKMLDQIDYPVSLKTYGIRYAFGRRNGSFRKKTGRKVEKRRCCGLGRNIGGWKNLFYEGYSIGA